jgi:hypothetical protein
LYGDTSEQDYKRNMNSEVRMSVYFHNFLHERAQKRLEDTNSKFGVCFNWAGTDKKEPAVRKEALELHIL